jgi:hypothetical protein
MPLQKLPTASLDDLNHRRRARETINQILDHSFDDSRVRTPGEVADGTTPVNFAYPPGHVFRYGAKHDGVTDDTAAYQTAGRVSLHPYAPSGSTVITGSIPILDNQHWALDGTVINITGTAVQVFTATTVDDWSLRWEGGSCVGDNGSAGATSGSAAALKIVDCMRFFVTGINAKNIKGWGILVQPGSSTSDRAEHGIIVAPQFAACYRGMEVQAGTGAEYITIVSPHATRCNIGILAAAGNTNIVGGNASDNTVGLMVGNGTNHAHGIITGMNLNHNVDFNLHCDNVVNGQTFTGCHSYEGGVFFEESKGLLWEGGIFDSPIYNYSGANSGYNKIRGAWCPGGYGFIRQQGTNNGHDELIIEDCWGPGALTDSAGGVDAQDNLTINDVSDMHVYAARPAGSTQSLTSGVAADLVFGTEVFDRRAAYNNSTGITTIPAEQTGLYRVTANCLFGGTGMSATGSFIDLQVNGSSKGGFFPSIFSTTKLQIGVDFIVHLAATDTVKLRATIVGTTPTFGDSSWDCPLSVERIA